ncbi:MAG: hypothetical protein IPG89_10900 [Bacteroidetes bacterium]|nr:hypothetical protein [Bacteroidota bacterium]
MQEDIRSLNYFQLKHAISRKEVGTYPQVGDFRSYEEQNLDLIELPHWRGLKIEKKLEFDSFDLLSGAKFTARTLRVGFIELFE